MANEPITYEVRKRVAYVTLNRPDHGNLMNEEMHQALAQVWPRVNEDEGVWAVAVTGAGKDFCLGDDVHEIAGEHREGRKVKRWALDEAWQRKYAGFAPTFGWPDPTKGLPGKPMVVAINGRCHGAGMMFPAFAEFVLAADDAEFAMPNVHMGNAPNQAVLALSRMMQRPPVMQLALLGKYAKWTADRARQLGLVFETTPADNLQNRLEEVMETMLTRSATIAIRAARTGWWSSFPFPRGNDYRIHHIFMAEVRVTSEDSKEGPRAFAEKRLPEWKAR